MVHRIPHTFDELVGTRPARDLPMLLCGAGMSWALVPTPRELIELIQQRKSEIEKTLGVTWTPLLNTEAKTLYKWADEIYRSLQAAGMKPREAKLKIAEVLCVTTDPCWTARASVPLRGTTPRHRVVARFAREGKWHAVWSLNWDVWIERALESVGLDSYPPSEGAPSLPKGWVGWYESWLPTKDILSDDAQTLLVHKPHGCVSALLRGEDPFILTAEELAGYLDDLAKPIQERIDLSFQGHSLFVVGWSASEPYFWKRFQLHAEARSPKSKLTIIDPNPNVADGHGRLIAAYKTSEAAAICQPEGRAFPTTDDIFLWVQTRHGLASLSSVASSGEQKPLESLLEAFSVPVPKGDPMSFVTDWFDNFLPVWLRVCFNSRRQKFFAGLSMEVEAVPTHRRDEHIPWNDQSTERLDLMAAKLLLLALHRHGGRSASPWDFEIFPGALWERSSHHLIVPVPSWAQAEMQSLGALKPLVESRHWAYQGAISKVSLLGLDAKSDSCSVAREVQMNWRYELSRLMHFSAFASPANISWLTLREWEGSL
jgi:hypothetical protein